MPTVRKKTFAVSVPVNFEDELACRITTDSVDSIQSPEVGIIIKGDTE